MDCFDKLQSAQLAIDEKAEMILEIIENFNNEELGWPLDYIAEDVLLDLIKYKDPRGSLAKDNPILLQLRIQNLDENGIKEGAPLIINEIDYQTVMDARDCDESYQKLHRHLFEVVKKISDEHRIRKNRADYLNALDLDLEVFRNVQNILMLKMEYRGKDLKAMPVHEKIELLKLAGAKGL